MGLVYTLPSSRRHKCADTGVLIQVVNAWPAGLIPSPPLPADTMLQHNTSSVGAARDACTSPGQLLQRADCVDSELTNVSHWAISGAPLTDISGRPLAGPSAEHRSHQRSTAR